MRETKYSPRQIALREALKEARLQAGYTQIALAAAIGRRQPFVSKYEDGECRIQTSEWMDVLRILGKDPADLLKRLQEIEEER